MRGTDVVGYQIDGAVYCCNCADLTAAEEEDSEIASPFFALTEGVEDEECSECFEPLVENLDRDVEEEDEEDEPLEGFDDVIAQEEELEDEAAQDPLLEDIDVENDLADLDEEEEEEQEVGASALFLLGKTPYNW